jgi:hypothetical protein
MRTTRLRVGTLRSMLREHDPDFVRWIAPATEAAARRAHGR